MKYAIRSGWVSNSWCIDGGYPTFDAVSISEWHGIPGSEASSPDDVRWQMRLRHPESVEVTNLNGTWTPVALAGGAA